MATCSADSSLKLWNINEEPKLVKSLLGHQKWIWDCAFSADSAYIVTGILNILLLASSDNTAKLWDINSGAVIRTYTGHHKALVCVSLHDLSN